MDIKKGHKYDYRQLREIINANHDRFSELNYDTSLSLQQKMNALVEWFKVLLQEYNEWVEYLEEFQEKFDEKLYETVEDILQKWKDDGILGELINDVLFKSKADVKYVDDRFNELSSNVKKYGAIGDGVTDDTLAIQKALTENDVVFFPKGVYVVNQLVLKTNNIISGYNKISTVIKQLNGENKPLISVPAGVTNTEINNITIEGLEKYVGGTGIQHGVGASASTPTNRHRLRNVYVKNFRIGVFINWYTTGLVADDVTCEYCGDGFILQGSDATITNILTAIIQRDGIRIEGDTNKGSNCKAYYCGLSGNFGAGLKIVGCNYSSFTNFDIQENVLDCIFIQDSTHLLLTGVADGPGIRYAETNSIEYTDSSGRCPISALQLVRTSNLTLNLVIFNGRQTSSGEKWQGKYSVCVQQPQLSKNNVISIQDKDTSVPEANAKLIGFRWLPTDPNAERQTFANDNKVTFGSKNLDPSIIDIFINY